jgi:hypothetical protein
VLREAGVNYSSWKKTKTEIPRYLAAVSVCFSSLTPFVGFERLLASAKGMKDSKKETVTMPSAIVDS